MTQGGEWVLAGNLVYAACQYGVLAAIARAGSLEDVGRFSLGLAVAAPITILASLHLRAILATDASHEFCSGAYWSLRLIGAVFSLLAIGVVCVLAGYDRGTVVVVIAIGVAKAAELLSDLVYGFLQRAGRLRSIAASVVARGVCSVALIAVVMWVTDSLAIAAWVMALGWVTLHLAIDRPVLQGIAQGRLELGSTWSEALELARVALPMGVVMCLAATYANMPRYFIQMNDGSGALGQFAAMVYLGVAVSQPAVAMGAAASPRLARAYLSGGVGYRDMCMRFILQAAALGAGASLAMATLGPWVLTLAYGAEYAQRGDVLEWLAIGVGLSFVTSAFGYCITAARKFQVQLVAASVTLLASLIACALLVPAHGLKGAAWSMLVVEASRAICLGGVLSRLLRSCVGAPEPRVAATVEPGVGLNA